MTAPEPSTGEAVPAAAPVSTAALYPRWATSVLRIVLSMLLSSVIVVPATCIGWARSSYATGANQPLTQPVAFDHRHHVRDDGIDCRYCHDLVERSAAAGVPSTELCLNCHGQVWNRAPVLAALRGSFFRRRPLRWQRVFTLPSFVFFNHVAHVRRNVGCVSCHERIDLMAQVYMPRALTMSFCLDCHRQPERYLRPAERITDMEWVAPGSQLELGARIKAEQQIAPPLHCSGCHR